MVHQAVRSVGLGAENHQLPLLEPYQWMKWMLEIQVLDHIDYCIHVMSEQNLS